MTMIDPEGGTAREEFDYFYEAAWPGALRLATLLTQQSGVAEDLAQDAFAKILVVWGRVERPAAYLNATLVNTCRRWHRRRAGERDRLPLLLPTDDSLPVFDELGDALAALPYRQRAVLVLRYYGDASESDIADALGCRPGTVKSLASRARNDLVTALVEASEEGDRLSAAELFAMIGGLVFAGYDTTRNQLGLALFTFCQHPDQWALLAEQPELAPRAVDEVMRLVGAVSGVPRLTVEDVEVAGYQIPAGTIVCLSVGSGESRRVGLRRRARLRHHSTA